MKHWSKIEDEEERNIARREQYEKIVSELTTSKEMLEANLIASGLIREKEDMLENETPQEYYARHMPGLAEHIAKCICKWFDTPYEKKEYKISQAETNLLLHSYTGLIDIKCDKCGAVTGLAYAPYSGEEET